MPAKDIDDYLANLQTDEGRTVIARLREIVHEEVPDAEERISYDMPTFRRNNKNFFWCAAFKKHASIFGQPMSRFEEELKSLKTSKGTIQFPYGKPLPEDLIRRLIQANFEN